MKTQIAAALLLLGATAAQAQDSYWPLAGNKIYNTQTGAVTPTAQALDPFGGFGFDGGYPVIFNANKELLFTGGSYAFSFSVGPNAQHVFAIPNKCRQYVAFSIGDVGTPHGHYLNISHIDATAVTNDISTTGLPAISTETVFSEASAIWYGAAAGKLNPDGSRCLYHLNMPASPAYIGSQLTRYTFDPNGNLKSSTPEVVADHLPTGRYLHIAGDGSSLAYFDENGQLVTYDTLTHAATTYAYFAVRTTYPTVIPTCEFAIESGVRRWFVGSDTQMGYVTEGTATSYYQLSTDTGTNSSLALGRDGHLYFAYNKSGVTAGAGQLYWIKTDGSFAPKKVTGATIATTISGTAYTPSYTFGNQVAGEDINSATAAPAINSVAMSGTGGEAIPAAAPTQYRCPGETEILQASLGGFIISKKIEVRLGTLSGGSFIASSPTYPYVINDRNTSIAIPLNDIAAAVAAHSGACEVKIYAYGPCDTVFTTRYFNVINASVLLDFMFNAPGGTTVSSSGISTLGASSAGILNYTNTVSGTGVITSYTITIYDPAGSILGTVTSTSPLTGVQIFNAITSGYFTTNYSSYIGSNPTFSVKYEINTANCGAFSKTAFFKINSSMPWMRQTKTTLKISPNPVENRFMIQWYEPEASAAKATLLMTDMMGKVLLRQEWLAIIGNNSQTVDMANLPAGMYYYQFESGRQIKNGTLLKK
jgi:hypothetical protein